MRLAGILENLTARCSLCIPGKSAMTSVDSRPRGKSGCAPMLLTGVMLCLLVLLNGAVLSVQLATMQRWTESWLGHPKVHQMLGFVAPLIMAVAELWLLDFLVDLRRRR